jgi:hypothetical protein
VSGKVSLVSDHTAFEGRFLDFYLGEWANDSAQVCRVLSVIRPTLIYIRLSLVAPGTRLQLLKWQVLIQLSVPLFCLDIFTAFQREGRIVA